MFMAGRGDGVDRWWLIPSEDSSSQMCSRACSRVEFEPKLFRFVSAAGLMEYVYDLDDRWGESLAVETVVAGRDELSRPDLSAGRDTRVPPAGRLRLQSVSKLPSKDHGVQPHTFYGKSCDVIGSSVVLCGVVKGLNPSKLMVRCCLGVRGRFTGYVMPR